MKKAAVYYVTATDMTHLGGPMGSEYTVDMWTKYFPTEAKAKKFAEDDYKKLTRAGVKKRKIKWVWDEEVEYWYSGDLSFISYSVGKIKLENERN